MTNRTCSDCNKIFICRKYGVRKYCDECISFRKGSSSRARKQIYPCFTCKKDIGKRKRKFCSELCKIKQWEKEYKGIDPYGFVMSRQESFGRRVRFHRYVVEQYFGRKLKRDEVVHHINLNKFDNRIENLVVMSNSTHRKLHHYLDINQHIKDIVSSK
jgi:hypothetical protein